MPSQRHSRRIDLEEAMVSARDLVTRTTLANWKPEGHVLFTILFALLCFLALPSAPSSAGSPTRPVPSALASTLSNTRERAHGPSHGTAGAAPIRDPAAAPATVLMRLHFSPAIRGGDARGMAP